jgi:hypothetical protein
MTTEIWFNEVKRGPFCIRCNQSTPFHVSEILERLRQETGISECNQSYYFEGFQVFTINPYKSSQENCYGIIDTYEIPKSCLYFQYNSDSPILVYLNSSTNNCVFHGLKKLSLNPSISHIFTRQFQLVCNNKKIKFNTYISDIPDGHVIQILTRKLEDPCTVNILYNKHDPTFFEFSKNTKIGLFKKYLELYYNYSRNFIHLASGSDRLENNESLGSIESLDIKVSFSNDAKGGSLTFPLENLNTFEHNPRAPSFRTVKKGLSWKCVCPNPECTTSRQFIIENSQFGVFDLSRTTNKLRCPICSNFIQARTFGFYKTRFKVYGVKENGEKIEDSGEYKDDIYYSYDESSHTTWKFLNIETKELSQTEL